MSRAAPKKIRMQFLYIAKFERGRTLRDGRWILNGEWVSQNRVQWFLFPDGA